MVELRIRTPRKLSLTDKELVICSLKTEESELEATRSAVNRQIDEAIAVAKLWSNPRTKTLITSSSMYPIVKHS